MVASLTWLGISRGIVHPTAALLEERAKQDSIEEGEQEEGEDWERNSPGGNRNDVGGSGSPALQEPLVSPHSLASGPPPQPPAMINYSTLVRSYCGKAAARGLNAFLIANALG